MSGISASQPPGSITGVDHIVLTVTDLDVSERFYTAVLGLTSLFDFGSTRLLVNKRNGFTLGLATHSEPDGTLPGGAPFTHTRTGLDHLGFPVGTREELVQWERHLAAVGVEFTPIRDMEFGHHLNFRDPDNIALELSAPTELMRQALEVMATTDLSDDELRARAGQHFGMPDRVTARPVRTTTTPFRTTTTP